MVSLIFPARSSGSGGAHTLRGAGNTILSRAASVVVAISTTLVLPLVLQLIRLASSADWLLIVV